MSNIPKPKSLSVRFMSAHATHGGGIHTPIPNGDTIAYISKGASEKSGVTQLAAVILHTNPDLKDKDADGNYFIRNEAIQKKFVEQFSAPSNCFNAAACRVCK